MLLVFVVAMSIYLWSMPRTVVLEDDGYFILASWFNGIAHPPGYPLFTMLGHLAAQVLPGTAAVRVHTVSALFAALSCVMLWCVIYKLYGNRLLALTGAFMLAVSRVFWSQAIIAEVYTLNCFLFLCLFRMGLELRDRYHQDGTKLLFSMAVVTGFGLSNHWPLLVLASPALVFLIWPARHRIMSRLPLLVAGLCIGLLPYVWMVWRSQMNPEISFFGPIESLSDFWFYLSRKPYASVDTSFSLAGTLCPVRTPGMAVRNRRFFQSMEIQGQGHTDCPSARVSRQQSGVDPCTRF